MTIQRAPLARLASWWWCLVWVWGGAGVHCGVVAALAYAIALPASYPNHLLHLTCPRTRPPMCVQDGGNPCGSPLFSVIRHLAHRDVAVPPFNPRYEPYFEPWGQKREQAFFR